MSAKTSQIHEYKMQVVDLTTQVVALDQRLQQVSDRKNELADSNDDLRSQNDELALMLARAEQANERLTREIEWLKLDKHNLNQHNNQLIDERDALKQRLNAASMPADSVPADTE